MWSGMKTSRRCDLVIRILQFFFVIYKIEGGKKEIETNLAPSSLPCLCLCLCPERGWSYRSLAMKASVFLLLSLDTAAASAMQSSATSSLSRLPDSSSGSANP
ncbi:unnamed protein product [Pipistrellus nathusii]|uniref:Secreted protein n=1 Tax=Pipistrellus nathusii TaxID=59473 RepID=A0ABN9ZTH0_PIPNA